MRPTRRQFIRRTSIGLAAAWGGRSYCAPGPLDSECKRLANRRRRIIFNDDGDDVWSPNASTPEGFVSVRLRHMLDTQADTLFYCTTQSFNYFTHNTKVGEVFLSGEGAFQHNNMQALLDLGTDPLKLAIEFAHKNGVEAVWTLRMNDIHDAFTPPLFPQWKRDHPDALLGAREDWDAHPAGSQHRWWAGVDFTRQDVRERTLELIAEVARDYDVDGIDLDWLRHPIHFPETLEGRPVTRKQINLITGLVREARAALGKAGTDRGRPILLSVRVPLTVEHGLYMGTDVETWLKENLVDFITTGGGYVPYSMPVNEIVALAKSHGAPVYPCISNSGMLRRKPFGPGTTYCIEGWRAAAANAFEAGADGVSLFNLFPAPGQDEHNAFVRQAFNELGDPATLAGKDKLFCLDNAAHLDGCGYINHVVPYRQCLPKPLEKGQPTQAVLPVHDDLSGALDTLELRVQIEADAELDLRLNGQQAALKRAPELDEEYALTWFTAPIPRGCVKKGANQAEVTLAESAEGPTRLTGLELLVRYA